MTIITIPIPQGPITRTPPSAENPHGEDLLITREWYKYLSLIVEALGNSTTYVQDTSLANAIATGRLEAFSQRIGQLEALIPAALLRQGSSFASTTEQLTGTTANKSSTPDSVAALWEKGSDIASAATLSIGEGGFFHVIGTTAITDIDWGTDKSGRKCWLVFDGILTLTYDASTLILPGSTSIVTAAGDCALVASEGSDIARVLLYVRRAATVPTGKGIWAPLVNGVTPGPELIANPAGECIMVELP
jgi:hypothetical protein